MSLTWMLLILAAALIIIGALRFDVLMARWREIFKAAPVVREPPPATPLQSNAGLHPHAAPPQKPAFHRSGKRH